MLKLIQVNFGTYELFNNENGRTHKCVVTVQDTTPPNLELKNISIWNDQKVGSYKDFIVSVSDASGEPTTECKTTINYNTIGDQAIVIEATDVNGNKQEKTCTLTIKKDTTGPVIYGLKDLTVNKHSSINFDSGVYAVDNKDGNCSVTSDGSSVNTNVYGTYYATYTSVDLSGNSTTSKRKIIVNHDQEDLNNKINEFYNNYCAGLDPESIAAQVRQRIKYSSSYGNNDPVWYGLTNGSGNCYVHATTLQVMLQKAGYSNQLIWLTDRSHYWNLVSYSGGWWHLDSTPSGNHSKVFLSDAQKLSDVGLHGKTWDTSAWPASPTYNIR